VVLPIESGDGSFKTQTDEVGASFNKRKAILFKEKKRNIVRGGTRDTREQKAARGVGVGIETRERKSRRRLLIQWEGSQCEGRKNRTGTSGRR